MKWSGRRQSDNVIDRRNAPRRSAPFRMGLGGVVILALVVLANGGDPRVVLSLLERELAASDTQVSSSAPQPRAASDSDRTKELVSVTLADLEERWAGVFERYDMQYTPAPLILFRGGTDTACGFGQSATGPFYCPADRSVYLDLGFMEDLERLGGRGDFGLAYVIAHEVGHHVQTLLDSSMGRRRQGREDSIGTELQADCFAGIWAHFAHEERGFLEPRDIDDGLATAAAVGDDHIQRSTAGRVSPETFTHGTSEQRKQAFLTGFTSGDMRACSFR